MSNFTTYVLEIQLSHNSPRFLLYRRHDPDRPMNRFQLRSSIEIPPLAMTLSLSPDAQTPGTDASRKLFYGTRLATVLLVGRDGRVLFVERDIWKLGGSEGEGKGSQQEQQDSPTRGDPRAQRVFRFYLAGSKSSENTNSAQTE